MTAWFSAPLSVVLALSAAAPPGAECGSDLACVARANTAAARHASPADKASHLLTAARSLLALFRTTGEAAQLCQARRLVVRSAALPHEHLGDRPAETRREIDAELKRLGHECRQRPKAAASPAPAPAVPTQAEEAPSETPAPPAAEPDTQAEDMPPVQATSPAPPNPPPHGDSHTRELGSVSPAQAAPLPAPDRAAVTPPAPSLAKRPDQKLLIAGGALLGSAALAGGLAGFARARVEAARTEASELAATAAAQGYTDPDTAMAEQEAEARALRWHRGMIATAVVSGVLGATAITLLAAGIRLRARPHKNLALRPTLTGLLFTARF